MKTGFLSVKNCMSVAAKMTIHWVSTVLRTVILIDEREENT